MVPRFSTQHFSNCVIRDVESFGDRLPVFPTPSCFSDFSDLLIRKLRIRMSFSRVRNVCGGDNLSPFLDHITNIIELSPKKQVTGIDAGWIITGMKDLETFRDRPMYSCPGDSMSTTPNELPVSIMGKTSQVGPTSVWTSRAIGKIKDFFQLTLAWGHNTLDLSGKVIWVNGATPRKRLVVRGATPNLALRSVAPGAY